MSKRQPQQPAAPDPAATARAQGVANREAAEASQRLAMIEEVSPFGTAKFEPTGTQLPVSGGAPVDQFRRTVSLDPAEQAILDKERAIGQQLLGFGQGQLSRVEGSVADPFTLSGLPPRPEINEAARKQIEDALFQRATSRLDPRYEKERTRLETSLLNKGFSGPGAEGYDFAIDEFERAKTDAYDQARLAAEAGAAGEQGRLFGLESTSRERALSEALLERGLPLQELQALMGVAPGVTAPQFAPLPAVGVSPADVTGPTSLAYQGALNTFNQQMGAKNAQMGGLYGLGAAGIMAGLPMLSDPKAKTDKREISEEEVLAGIETMPVESWRYKGDTKRRIGPYADDFAERFGGDGKTIDIPTMFGVSLAAIKALADKVERLERKT